MNLPYSFPNGSLQLYLAIAGTLVVGFGLMFAMMSAPPVWRRRIVAFATFLAGAIYVAYYLWPKAQSRGPNDLPHDMVERVAFNLQDFVAAGATISQTLTTFLLGLGIYSLARIHGKKLVRMQKDWGFSLLLLASMAAIVLFGYWNYYQTKFSPAAPMLQDYANWGPINYINDFLFDGLLQQMDGAMFSIIAFYILSAAYRAFRIRSIESTILLAAAFVMMLSLMGGANYLWDRVVDPMAASNPFWNNIRLTETSSWIRNTFQTSGLRALDFGVGLGALAMGLRLWLSLERGGVSA